jgi:formylglycine-generating enzyme required for sulfatase activity
MLELEWVEIPEGEFTFGLLREQGTDILSRMRTERDMAMLEKDAQFSGGAGERLFQSVFAEKALMTILKARVVKLPKFYISRFPITHAQADAFYASEAGDYWRGWRAQPIYDPPNMPEQASYRAAEAMAAWFGGRLPKVYEWEKAARGTDGRLYPWGNEWEPWRGNFGHEFRPESSKKVHQWVSVVNGYPGGVSPYGVWDMAGNLAEWTKTESHLLSDEGTPRHLVKGLGTKQLGYPEWFYAITPMSGVDYNHVCLRPVRDSLP